jgi:response regulator NasT
MQADARASRDVLERRRAGDDPRRRCAAGVSAYVADGLEPNRIKTIIDVAVARFEDCQRLREELAEANQKLSERKLVELSVAEVAEQIIEAADLLGA